MAPPNWDVVKECGEYRRQARGGASNATNRDDVVTVAALRCARLPMPMPMRGQRVAFHSKERPITYLGTVNGTAGVEVRRETASCVQCVE